VSVVVTLGDPHLGRQFPGTPLHRRGEREAMQWKDLEASLATECDIHVCMGDLFDKAVVPYEVILRAARAYKKAATAAPGRLFVVLAGNHDVFKEVDRVSAFNLFAEILREEMNIMIPSKPVRFGDHVFIPWQPFVDAAEYVELHEDAIHRAAYAYGHWDIVAFGDKDQNKIPASQLASLGVRIACTGHDHLPGHLEIDGLMVVKTGSMQPYSHGEDPEDRLYETVTVDQLAEPRLKNKCVRVQLTPDEAVPAPIDCLQWSVIRKAASGVEDAPTAEEVSLEDFSFSATLREAFDECLVPDPTRTAVLARLEENAND
jgi:DNA repair exonuclease SbcCD nuclease subunit